MSWTPVMRLLDSLWERLWRWMVCLYLLCRLCFLPLMNKRRETVLYLLRKERAYRLRKERAYRTLWPGALASPLPLCTNL